MNNLAVIEQPGRALTAVEVRAQVNLIQEVMQGVMKEGTHYGKIPGCDQPTLLKPGAEKIMATFRLAADPEVEDLSSGDEIRYRIRVRMVSPSGVLVGTGIGECSTNEEKYKWRRAVCDQEFNEMPENRRREKWARGKSGPYKMKQVRTEPADLANTVLKMAKKRALVDGVLTATAASDIFAQDLEELPEELREEFVQERRQSAGVAAAERAAQTDNPARQELVAKLEEVAKQGWPALQKAWSEMSQDDRLVVGPEFGRIKKLAEGA